MKKTGLELNIPKTKIVASKITSWQIEGEKAETVTGFLGSKITADGDAVMKLKHAYSLEEKL